MTTAHHGGDRGALSRGQGRASQAFTGQTTSSTSGGDDGIEAVCLRRRSGALIEARAVERGCAGNVDNDRHRKSSDMSIFRFPATVIGLFDRLLIREQNPALLSRGPGGIFLSATILPRVDSPLQ
ncbi:hypothetical protein HMPREF3165_10400 [Actinomyces sp. HMSC08A09]|uniref:Uncharacterized protein n=1 Tax=Pauljensenia hongkongensis TaxID=178339 RepID=A0A1D8B392_9ACTO|nr:hypothetical protein AXE84_06990 [Actinomyces oris]AOS47604.1 hypothetical protein BH719_06880 [Pauljensenia hongkongensis]EFW25953.1 hypothetical protein HMPREF9057_02683 [Actinomyces sp. oral taxon 171 str. F0337]OFT34826.1 hypothetical protein HMPREF3165_10400 [Actinomyces sp. HMSC08A09]